MDREKLYKAVNSIYECIEEREIRAAKLQLEKLLNDIKYGIYD